MDSMIVKMRMVALRSHLLIYIISNSVQHSVFGIQSYFWSKLVLNEMQQPTNHGICRWSKVEKHPVHLGGGVWGLQCMGDNVIKCILPGTASLHQLRWWASVHLTCVYPQQCEYLHTCAILHQHQCRRVRTLDCSLASSTIWCASKSNHCTPPTLSLTILNCLLMIMRGLLGPSLFKRANLPFMHLGWPFQCIRVTVLAMINQHILCWPWSFEAQLLWIDKSHWYCSKEKWMFPKWKGNNIWKAMVCSDRKQGRNLGQGFSTLWP